ncbi:MAG: Nif3-like dinuclear metal center hexameric protein [Desulfamplus sp.]|nr:Nif3-like dinuclear metal center hexameric protein [Desulfamplus sp.]
MNTTVRDVCDIIDSIAPFSLAEPWDNCGLQAGSFSSPVKRILVALDASMDAMSNARLVNADMLLTHHPLMLTLPKVVDFDVMPGVIIKMAVKGHISVVSAHTNLDKARGGLNDYFAQMAGLKELTPLVKDDSSPGSISSALSLPGTSSGLSSQGAGLGRVGLLEKPLSLKFFALELQKTFNADIVRIVGNPEQEVRSVAVCTGSGGSLLKHFFSSGAELFVTGDIKYHEARDIEAAGRGLIDLGHFATEQIAVTLLAEKLEKAFLDKGLSLEILTFQAERDPFMKL